MSEKYTKIVEANYNLLSMATVNTFEELEIWQLSREICQDVWNAFENTSLGKDFELKNQMNRSSGSIMDNIAEGFERNGNKVFHDLLGKVMFRKPNTQTDKVTAKKQLGQHFLTDKGIAQRIGELMVDDLEGVMEIGPGMGALTVFLLEEEKNDLWAMDVDRDSIAYLHEHFPQLKDKIFDKISEKITPEVYYPQSKNLYYLKSFSIAAMILFAIKFLLPSSQHQASFQ